MELDKQRACAQLIMGNPDMIAFLEEKFCPNRSKIRQEIEKNIVALSNEQYGEAMKVLFTSEAHFYSVMSEIKGLIPPQGKGTVIAPK